MINELSPHKTALPTPKSDILALTGLRAFAAAYVFVFHMHIRWPLAKHGFFKHILDQGAVGMSIFFILSGFLLAYRYKDNLENVKDYLVNRFARIYPVYFFAALISIPSISILFKPDNTISLFQTLLQICFLVICNVLLLQAWFPPFFSFWNDGASWSISVEFFCYCLLPIALPILINRSPKQLILISILLYFLSILPGLSAALFPSAKNDVFYSVPIYRLPEFLLGICAYLITSYYTKFSISQSFQWAILALGVIYLGFFGNNLPLYIGHNWIITPVILGFLISLLNSTSFITKIFSSTLAVWLGKISYCFYSFQIIVISFLIGNNYSTLVSSYPLFKKSWFLLLVAFVMLIVFSSLGYYFIEEPCRRLIKTLYKSHK